MTRWIAMSCLQLDHQDKNTNLITPPWLDQDRKVCFHHPQQSRCSRCGAHEDSMLLIAAIGLLAARAHGSESSEEYLDWLVKSACLDKAGSVSSEDPYFGCSSGLSRKIKVGDPLPYNNYEQMGYQICDSFSLLDSAGETLYLHTFDYAPFNEFNQHSGSDGYDVYSINSNTVSISNTKDGGGYGSTFFGKQCSFGNGWALFPTTNFLEGGQGYWPIAGAYWEHNAMSSPGPCPSGYSTNTLTSWELVKGFQFGGVNGNPVKTLDALVSYHGLETEKDGVTPTDNFLRNGHLEVFYFTRLYGLTRWEVWFPVTSVSTGTEGKLRAGKVSSATECSGTGTGTYKGISYTITDCHDWSQVKPVEAVAEGKRPSNASDVVKSAHFMPSWPLVNANLLQHPHFEASGLSESYQPNKWCRFGSSPAGQLINWSALVSTTGGDASNGVGVAYLAMNCGAGADGQCGSPGSQAVYQDLPVTEDVRVCEGCTFLFGANARTAPGQGEGTLQLAVQLLDTQATNGTVVVWQDVVTASVQADNGDGRGAEAESVYLSAKFVSALTTLPQGVLRANYHRQEAAGSRTSTSSGGKGSSRYVLRFLIIPVTAHTFHIADAFFNRFPSITA